MNEDARWLRVTVRSLGNAIVLTNLSIMASGMLGLMFTSRYLGVEGRGLYLTWSSWSALIGTLALLGTEAYVVVASHSLGKEVSLGSLWPMLATGIGTGAVVTGSVLWLLSDDWRVSLGGILFAAASQVVAVNTHVQLANSHHGWNLNLARVAAPLTGLFAVVAAIPLLSPDPEVLFLCLGSGLVIGALLSLLITHESHDRVPGFGRVLWRVARRGALLTLLSWGLANSDTVIVSVFGSSQDVGLYGVGVAGRGVVFAVGSAVGIRWFAERVRMDKFSIMRALLPATAVAMLVVVSAPWGVPLVLGEEFRSAVPAVQVLACAGVLVSVDSLLTRMLMIDRALFLPTLVRLVGTGALVGGVAMVRGDATASAAVYCATLALVVVAQAAILVFRQTRTVRSQRTDPVTTG